jgi:hypothetical protein
MEKYSRRSGAATATGNFEPILTLRNAAGIDWWHFFLIDLATSH